ncbi:MAG: hypothetical protein KDD41_10040 [Flavobacteriales bacterium]|nr:hypothetical protein [Flavobacteriales bacterium]
MSISYPQYRKYKNNKSYFKILSPEGFEEILILPNKKEIHRFEAKILPDRNLIHDLTYAYESFADIITEEEYEALKSSVGQS